MTIEAEQIEAQDDQLLQDTPWEYGIRYLDEVGWEHVVWGFSSDPRNNGIIDDSGEYHLSLRKYVKVIGVGRRPVYDEVWEDFTLQLD